MEREQGGGCSVYTGGGSGERGGVGVASRWETEWLVLLSDCENTISQDPLACSVTHDRSVEVKHRDASAPRMQGRL